MTAGRVVTVQGEVGPADLGPTLPHEHLISDLRIVFQEPHTAEDRAFADAPITLETITEVRYRPFSHRRNLVLDDVDEIAGEVRAFVRAGGRTLVDVTPAAIGRDVRALRRLSDETGVHVIAGCGHYTQRWYPPGTIPTDPEAIADELCRELLDGVDGTGIRPGVIGEVGTSPPPSAGELAVLRGVALAHRRTGAPVSVHLSSAGRWAVEVLDALEAAGADPSAIALGHLDGRHPFDLEQHIGLARRGAYVEYDLFGWPDFAEEGLFLPVPGDLERIDAVRAMWDAGVGDRLLLSHDVCQRMQLRAYGGVGYAHLFRFIVPLFRKVGLTDEQIDTMIRANPARWLIWQAPSATA